MTMRHAVCRECLTRLTTGPVKLISIATLCLCCECGVLVGAAIPIILNPLRLKCRGQHQ